MYIKMKEILTNCQNGTIDIRGYIEICDELAYTKNVDAETIKIFNKLSKIFLRSLLTCGLNISRESGICILINQVTDAVNQKKEFQPLCHLLANASEMFLHLAIANRNSCGECPITDEHVSSLQASIEGLERAFRKCTIYQPIVKQIMDDIQEKMMGLKEQKAI
jgi:hypothetical protein